MDDLDRDENGNEPGPFATEDERGQGYFVDEKGRKVEGMIQFQVVDTETAYSYGKGFLTIEGTLLDDEVEEELSRRERGGGGDGGSTEKSHTGPRGDKISRNKDDHVVDKPSLETSRRNGKGALR